MKPRPALLVYSQHSLGLGHLVRSFALAEGLAEHFDVVLVCGGALPEGLRPPERVRLVALPPLGADLNGEILSRDRGRPLADARRRRRELLLETFRSVRPQVLVVELFPFGRRKFADELVPLLEEARAAPRRPVVVSSLRDILVGRHSYQEAHDTLSCVLANRYFDAILVHSDPRFARLEDSFRPSVRLRTPVFHTGFVVRRGRPASPRRRERYVVVSVGGGLVGEPLLRAALEAREQLPADLLLKVIAGPFLPEDAWRSLQAAARGRDGVELRRFVPDLVGELSIASASVSQCGYNTALDLLRSQVPALVVPFAGEDEQRRRAARLERLGAVRVLDPRRLDAARLAAEIRALHRFRPRHVALDLDGAQHSGRLLARLERADVDGEVAIA